MKYHPMTDRFEIFCHEHKPLQLIIEENKSFWERVDQINLFAEQYSELQRKNNELFKKISAYKDPTHDYTLGQNSIWTEHIKKILYEKLAE